MTGDVVPADDRGLPVEEERGRAIVWKAFEIHSRVYGLVSIFLVVIWALTTFGGYFWPIWPIVSWGLALGIHAAATFHSRP